MAVKEIEANIELTAGSIKNGYLKLPKGKEWATIFERNNGSTIFNLRLDGLGDVETSADQSRGTFKWRGWKKFFSLHDLGAGDQVILQAKAHDLIEVSPLQVRLVDCEANAGSKSGACRKTNKSGAGMPRIRTQSGRRCNNLDGATWLQYSLSVWNDIRKSSEEIGLKHPAMFPSALIERLIGAFMDNDQRLILDPFAGSGSSLVAAINCGKHGVGIELSAEYVKLAKKRISQGSLQTGSAELLQGDARKVIEGIAESSVDFVVTSPPYWDILNQQRSADGKDVRHYGNEKGDLGVIGDYERFLTELGIVFKGVFRVMRPRAYCCVIVMDLRKKSQFFPFHSDLARKLEELGFIYDDLIIWNRGHEYNNLRPLGYPYKFRINKIHEYVLIFQKPDQKRDDRSR